MKTVTIAKYRSRKFLNTKFGMAAIQVGAHYNEHEYAPKNDDAAPVLDREMDINVTISDCDGNISLDFYAHNEKQRKERIKKVNILIKELEKVRDILKSGEVGERKGAWE